MSALIQFSGLGFYGHPLIHALGWTLVHFCWQGALVAAVLWCVLGLFGGRSSQVRYGAACFALLLTVALPLITFARIASAEYQMRNAGWGSAIPLDGSMMLLVGAGEPAAPWTVRMAMALDHCVPWLIAAWFAGAMFFVVRLNFGLIVARRLRSNGTEAPSVELQEMFDGLRRRLGVERAVRLLHSARVQVPTVIGWLRPAVLMPASCLTGLSTEQIEAIFCHELAHVRRHDYLVSVFQSVVEALLFYHPAVWWVSKQVRRERECCCDEVAVANGGDVLAYAKALSYLEERRAGFPEFVLGANGGVLTMRIKRLLGCREDAHASQFAAFALLAMMVVGAGTYASEIAHAQAKSAAPVASVEARTGPVDEREQPQYKTWLNEDVVYIITPEERAAYMRLTNDEDRDRFIENFWSRRNPPGSAANTFRAEHYARIAYANEHFATDDRAGWKTDRGHVYIVDGKPESIDSHPNGGQVQRQGQGQGAVSVPYPFEIWHYSSMAGIGDNVDLEFVDTCRCGSYNYTIDRPGQPGTAQSVDLATRILGSLQVSYQPPTAEAQAAPRDVHGEGGIAGIVIDPAGAVVPRANVSASNADLGFTMVKHTDNSGKYSLSPLPAGRYSVQVWAPGFQRLLQTDVQVERSQQVGLNLKLRVSSVDESLNVTGSPVAAAQAAPPPPPSRVGAKVSGPIQVSSGVMAGNTISKVDPIYPADAKAAHVEGVVVLHATISKQGEIENVEVVSGPSSLIVSSVDAVRQWRYKPYLLNGEPTEVQTTININYTLGDGSAAQGSNAASGADLGLRRVGGDVTTPLAIYMVKPEYSEEARAAKFSGVVLVSMIVDERGIPQDVHVLRGVGMGLDEKAVEAVKQYRFKPAMEGGRPVRVQISCEVNFRMGGAAGFDTQTAAASSAANTPPRMRDGATAPVVIHTVEPEFSEEARKAKFMGVVLVNLIVDAQGRPQNVHVLRGVGKGLDKKAVDAVKQYKFKPAMKDNKPVEEALNVEVNFQIF